MTDKSCAECGARFTDLTYACPIAGLGWHWRCSDVAVCRQVRVFELAFTAAS